MKSEPRKDDSSWVTVRKACDGKLRTVATGIHKDSRRSKRRKSPPPLHSTDPSSTLRAASDLTSRCDSRANGAMMKAVITTGRTPALSPTRSNSQMDSICPSCSAGLFGRPDLSADVVSVAPKRTSDLQEFSAMLEREGLKAPPEIQLEESDMLKIWVPALFKRVRSFPHLIDSITTSVEHVGLMRVWCSEMMK